MRFLIAFAFVSSTAFAQPPAEMSAAETTKWLAFFDQLVDAVVAHQDECGKMATSVSTVIDANKDSIAVARAARARHAKLPQSAQAHMLDGVKKMGPGIENCGDDTRVKAAFSKLDVKQPK